MRFRTKPVEDLGEARDLHAEFMPGCVFPGDDHQFWVVEDAAGREVAMCSAVVRPEKGYVYLSSASVAPGAQAAGLQRHMIRRRCAWGKAHGATYAVTYTLHDNYPSIVNLLRCGFRFASSPRGWAGYGSGVHYFEKEL